MTEPSAEPEDPFGNQELAQGIIDLIDRSIGKSMVEFADSLAELVADGGNLSKGDVVALLRQEGERLRQSGRGGTANPG